MSMRPLQPPPDQNPSSALVALTRGTGRTEGGRRDFGGAEQAAEKLVGAVILSPFAVILSAAKDLGISLRVNCAKNLCICRIRQMRRSFVACGSSG
jgi:hypothetical protein